MYRMLDLISEQSSGGLVEKIIIDQFSFQRLLDDLCPGAYVSLTRVNFKVLDQLTVKPVGIYGSRESIVELLLNLDIVDNATSVSLALISAKDDGPGPKLRSGLYFIRVTKKSGDDGPEQLYVVYWPEDTTWYDDAIDAVKRNRVTFMRYLTKITDQIHCFISPSDARDFVWKDDEETPKVFSLDDSHRLYTFEVSKTLEQTENVTMRQGFSIFSPRICANSAPERLQSDQFKPRLLGGEMAQSFITARYLPARTQEQPFDGQVYTEISLKALLSDSGPIELDQSLNEEAISALLRHGLDSRHPRLCTEWMLRKEALENSHVKSLEEKEANIRARLESEFSDLENCLRVALAERMVEAYPFVLLLPSTLTLMLTPMIRILDFLFSTLASIEAATENSTGETDSDGASFAEDSEEESQGAGEVPQTADKTVVALEEHRRRSKESSQQALQAKQSERVRKSSGFTALFGKFAVLSSTIRGGNLKDVPKEVQLLRTFATLTDRRFLQDLSAILDRHPVLQPLITNAIQLLPSDKLSESLASIANNLAHIITHIKARRLLSHAKSEQDAALTRSLDGSRRLLIQAMSVAMEANQGQRYLSRNLSTICSATDSFTEFRLWGASRTPMVASIECEISQFNMTANDRQELQRDPQTIPSPRIDHERLSHRFHLDVNQEILYCHLIGHDRCLLVLKDGGGNTEILFDRIIELGQRKKMLRNSRTSAVIRVAYDEEKRMLLVCDASKLRLDVFQFDDVFNQLQAVGSAFELSPWYRDDIPVSIAHACLICGREEVLLVDTLSQARIFSFVTRQFRQVLPAILTLERIPTAAYSSPEGSCVFLVYPTEIGNSLHAHHLSTFGHKPGVVLDLPKSLGDSTIVTSMVTRNSVHLVSLDSQTNECWSVALDITKNVTEFQFKEKALHSETPTSPKQNIKVHNSLIDCHSDVWIRFPVVAAVQSGVITAEGRLLKRITFVSDRDHGNFAPYFTRTIHSFEQQKQKPTGNVLRSIEVDALELAAASARLRPDKKWEVSQFRLGEWLVEMLCLIPIHLAITRENRFIPLRDGVVSTELEKSLLGAEVGQIIDSLSIGWYESIFQSYMAQKPVKVVSSMGKWCEQSVGKSYSLNHFVDSSFAGSAMRTTEGVWLSVTPTEEALIVALDFEGVHSIERSAQEDTLLVLFNTAISNLVLFRNNFALSRDITGLFQSFQSSSTVFDPAANPTLFQSMLVIIIKDVVDSDEREIVKEFSGKFQKIVVDEQESNWISRLHAGRLSIVPWPVIQSKQFYTLFPILKKRLDDQPITHPAAGEFLLTLKTLMAKLKANDWGALSQTLVGHRAQRLLDTLVVALTSGFADMRDLEPLKNLDTDLVIESDDADFHFFLSNTDSNALFSDKDSALLALINSWDGLSARSQMKDADWTSELSDYLANLVNLRIQHVQDWMNSNLSRFKTNHANIELLRRAFDTAVIELKSNVDLCKMQCASCQLLCLRASRHGNEEAHDCQTDHRCAASCEYEAELEGEAKDCGLPAGHPGTHICSVDVHLCGEPCKLSGKRGCLGECTKAATHVDDEHLCSAEVHACGEPCELKEVPLNVNTTYSCPGSCLIPSHIEHTRHGCDNLQCPFSCNLCKRLCSNQDHLHGLKDDAIHLCGEQHSCTEDCSAIGVCEIDTTPQKVEALFKGRHESFQYTKYSQTAIRRQCAIPIPAGSLSHAGPHLHSTAADIFHFCETRCKSCGYFCTLPRGHPQEEHETSHGSMSETKWAVEGPEGTALELNGRKFGADDEGAPMMCNLVCQELGRHAHLDYCRKDACGSSEIEHIRERLTPHPNKPKDWISHKLYWSRSGFKDPYSRDDQANFAKCDSMCSGPEHPPAQPSYCTLPLFHLTQASDRAVAPPSGGHLSSDGHAYLCKDPVQLQQAFHIIFVIDRSSSMSNTDRRPLPGTPETASIAQNHNNRIGAVYSALSAFWRSRHSATTRRSGQRSAGIRRDAYSIIMFDEAVDHVVINDFDSSPNALLRSVLRYKARRGTDFTLALNAVQDVLEATWDNSRSPVVIFLSDGEYSRLADATVRDLCRSSIALGKPLSFHAVSFGPRNAVMQRMVRIASDVQNSAPVDSNTPGTARVPSSYSEALDSVRLAETFLVIAESLKKPRGSLL
ncbi:hypothetical protein C8J56DRAFT_860684 [Mycena floridula]|nr:hypothetical protein C8J56DRAFT_860684 [Mycena floridula]